MNLEALIAALVPGRTGEGIEPRAEPNPGSPGFQDWLQRETGHVSPLPDRVVVAASPVPEAHSIENACGPRTTRRAADLTPATSERALAFAERPLLVETSLQFAGNGPSDRLSPSIGEVRWIGEVLQYRITDFLQGPGGMEDAARFSHPSSPLPTHSERGQPPNPAHKHLPVFRMVPVPQTTVGAAPQSENVAESPSEVWRRGHPTGALTARLMEHFGRMMPNGPVVHLQPEQDGFWKLFLRLPKLSESALAELGEELKSLVEAFGLKLGTFEIAGTQREEAR